MDLKCVPYNYIYSRLKVQRHKYYIKVIIESAVSQDWPFMAYMFFCYVFKFACCTLLSLSFCVPGWECRLTWTQRGSLVLRAICLFLECMKIYSYEK